MINCNEIENHTEKQIILIIGLDLDMDLDLDLDLGKILSIINKLH